MINTKIVTSTMLHILAEAGYIALPELRVMTGWNSRNNGEQRIDIWAIHPFPSKKLMVAFEVKVSRSDWLSELKKPRKRNYAMLYSNEFYIVAPEGVVHEGELPRDVGLIQIYPRDARPRITRDVLGDFAGYSSCKVYQALITVKPPYRDAYPPTWAFVASMLRRFDRSQREMLETALGGLPA